MKWIWRREWNLCKKDMFIQLVIAIVVPLFVCVIYKIKKTLLFTIASYIFSLPQELYALVGLNADVQSGNIMFFLFFTMVFLNAGIIWNGCMRTMQCVCMDESNGSIFLMCNQYYSRMQLGIMKLLWSLVSMVAIYVIWIVVILIMLKVGCINDLQFEIGAQTVRQIMGLGIPICCMMVSVVFLYVVTMDKKDMEAFSWRINLLVFGTILLGNSYKIRDVICWFFGKLEFGDSLVIRIREAFDWLENLYWISPLSWLNPFTLQQDGDYVKQICICVVIFVLASALGVWRYTKRNLYVDK